MHLDPSLSTMVAIIAVILLIGMTLQLMRQPQVVGYLLAGVAIGPFGFALLTAVGLSGGIISEVAYQYTIAVIALSLLVSPFWIRAARGVLAVTQIATMPVSGNLEPVSPAEKGPQATADNQH